MAICNNANVSYNLDYRSMKDDAWYACRVLIEDGKKLRVEFKDFEQSYFDEVFAISDFSSHHEVEEFLGRLRPVTEGIEENECSRVIEGMIVCATYAGDDGSLRYFDAIVDAVHYKQHMPEKCLCTYLLFWQHGPGKGNITASNLADICLIMPGAIDPTVYDFARLVREKLKGESNLISKRSFSVRKRSSNETTNKLQECSTDGQSFHIGLSEGRGNINPQLCDDDRDLGGVKETGCHHYILLENLEKDLSPSLMMEFIHEQTSIMTQAYVFPTLSTETYARAAIVLDCRTKLKRIYAFISNPNHFIISLSGRPWVIAEDTLRTGTFDTNLQSLEPKFENNNTRSKLMIARLGTAEYAQAQRLKDLYMEFRNHLNGLAQRLDREEEKIRRPSSAN